jgi:hypothetical protein
VLCAVIMTTLCMEYQAVIQSLLRPRPHNLLDGCRAKQQGISSWPTSGTHGSSCLVCLGGILSN